MTIINKLFQIFTELDARESSNNCIVPELAVRSWDELLDDAIGLIEQLRGGKQYE